DSLPFFHGDGLIRGNVCELVSFSAWPFYPQGRNPGFFSQTEGEHQLALREITGSAAQHLPLLFAGILNSNHSANAVAVGTCAPQLYAQGMVPISTVISKQKRRTGIGGDKEIQIAVII